MSQDLPEHERPQEGFQENLPFKVIVPAPREIPDSMDSAETDQDADVDESFSLDEIEAAYLKALETADFADSIAFSQPEPSDPAFDSASESPAEEVSSSHSEESFEAVSAETLFAGTASADEVSETAAETSAVETTVATLDFESEDPEPERLGAIQVVESMLFVGGTPLPVKKFLEILGGAHTNEQVEDLLESLNNRYRVQRRPYEIRLIEGGYKLQLIPEFEAVRERAYGHGPKEVKLAQDALEILAFVAYQQPVTREKTEETGKINVPGLLRQLIRRELVCIDRSNTELGECYRTTPRFLELFGLSALEDLPQAGTFNFK